MKEEVLILGCGVTGLSTGIELMRRGYPATIWAKELPPNTNSDKAAAVWYPYLCYPKEKAIPWARITFEYFQKEMLPDTKSGCVLKTLIKLFDRFQPEPWWKDAYPGVIERPSRGELPKGYVDGYKFQTIVIDTSIYMPYLVNRFKAMGGAILHKVVNKIDEALDESDLIINCTGLGSRDLFGDQKVYPVRGQMIKIMKTNLDQVMVDDDGPNSLALAAPRINDIMLGGTTQKDNWDATINPKDTQDILRKVRAIVPKLQIGNIISESVGFRPVRDSIRLEPEDFSGKTVIHNYGHGGAGFTLSWGCVKEVADLAEK